MVDKDTGTTKIRKLSTARIRKVQGGRSLPVNDPVNLVSDFLIRRGWNPEHHMQHRTSEIATWSVHLGEEQELEITIEGIDNQAETTLYMGVNVVSVPLHNLSEFLVSALTIADTLIGAKLSLVNYDLVLSVTIYMATLTVDEIEYLYELLGRQRQGVIESLTELL